MASDSRTAAGLIPNEEYWARIRARAKALGSDGCSKSRDWNLDCCLRHDIQERTGMDINGVPISAAENDAEFWECNRLRSRFSVLSPRSWARWAGVRLAQKLKLRRNKG